jgi:DNA-binding transcriptional ArsR family regulator
MVTVSSFAEIASLAGDIARAQMLAALMDGRALTATELARAARITPQTASGHLAKLADAGLLAVDKQGRHRYHRLASPAVAQMLEGIMALAAELETPGSARRPARVSVGPRDRAMRYARTCYDHLAGELAVAMADSLTTAGHVELSPEGGIVTASGMAFFRDMGIDLAKTTRASRRVFCRPCLDWSERRPHLAGTVGAALCACCLEQGWLRRIRGTRAIAVTPSGRHALAGLFNLSPFAGPADRE